ncbi:unnamed protein product, partial [Meganyctiphanes norvegica]
EDLEESVALHRWSSLELLPHDDDQDYPTAPSPHADNQGDSIFSHQFMSRVALERQSRVLGRSMEASAPPSPSLSPSHQLPGPCPSTVLLMVVHAGSVLDPTSDLNTKKSDLTTFKGALETVMRQHYPHMVGRVAIRLVSAPAICSDSLNVLSSLNPYGLDSSPVCGEVNGGDNVPVSAVPLLAAGSPEYEDSVSRVVASANVQFHEFLRSEEGHGFQGQVCVIGDSIGGVMAYDALCRGSGGDPSRGGVSNNIPEGETPSLGGYSQGLNTSAPNKPSGFPSSSTTSSSCSSGNPSPISPSTGSPLPFSSSINSPSITVSFETTKDGFASLHHSPSDCYPAASATSSNTSQSPQQSPQSPQSPQIPQQPSYGTSTTNKSLGPQRKTSVPLPPSPSHTAKRKISAPCGPYIPHGGGISASRHHISTSPSPPGGYNMHLYYHNRPSGFPYNTQNCSHNQTSPHNPPNPPYYSHHHHQLGSCDTLVADSQGKYKLLHFA